jgi:DNA polymerase-4
MIKKRIYAHVDFNCFYAAVNMLRNPRWRDVPMVVCGSTEERNGIILAANYPAKARGIKTAMSNPEARALCPDLVQTRAYYDDYVQFSGFGRELLYKYTDRIESFGLDESWIDLTGCVSSFDQGITLVHEIRERIKKELSLTVSIGLADNKIFAKLGSDMKKPDACTIIPAENFREIVWPLPVSDLLYVGPATTKKLVNIGINTIGQLANAHEPIIKSLLGKVGYVLMEWANGGDRSLVTPHVYVGGPPKSVSRSRTCHRDLVNDQDIKLMLYQLSEDVCLNLAKEGLKAATVEISCIGTGLSYFHKRQAKLKEPTFISAELALAGFELFRKHHGGWASNLRKIGIGGSNLVSMYTPKQLSLWEHPSKHVKTERVQNAVHGIRARFGTNALQRGIMHLDKRLAGIEEDNRHPHTIHPFGVFHGGVSVDWGRYKRSAGQ